MKKIPASFCLILLVLIGCKKEQPIPPPEAAFSIQIEEDCEAPCSVIFTNETKNGARYFWDFGDGSPLSEEESPTYTYTFPDTFEVRLEALGVNGVPDTLTQTIIVIAPPLSATFEWNQDSCLVPCSQNFESTTENAVSFSWDFGDGENSSEENPSHEFNSPGKFEVSLTVTDAFGNSFTYSDSVKITGKPSEASFNTNKTECTVPCQVEFTNSSENAEGGIFWDFGDPGSGGENFSEEQNPVHLFDSAGQFFITLYAIGFEGDTSVSTQSILVSYSATQAGFQIQDLPEACYAPCTITIEKPENQGDIEEEIWDYDDSKGITTFQSTYTFDSPGEYRVNQRLVGKDGESSEFFIDVIVLPVVPVPQIFVSIPDDCPAPCSVSFENNTPNKEEFTFSWDFGDGSPDYEGETPDPHIYQSEGSYTVTITASDDFTSRDVTLTINVASSLTPVAAMSFQLSGEPCYAPCTVDFFNESGTDIPIDSYFWDFGDNTSSTEMNSSHTFNQAGTYMVTHTVTGPGGTSQPVIEEIIVELGQADFTVLDLFPNNNPVGAPVQIVGTGFDNTVTVTFGGPYGSPESVDASIDPNRSDTYLNIRVPQTGSEGEVTIYVEKPGQQPQMEQFLIISQSAYDGLPASPPDIIFPTGTPLGTVPISEDNRDRILFMNVYDKDHLLELVYRKEGDDDLGSLEYVFKNGNEFISNIVSGNSDQVLIGELSNPVFPEEGIRIERFASHPDHPFIRGELNSPETDILTGEFFSDENFEFPLEILNQLGIGNDIAFLSNEFLLLTSTLTNRQYLFVAICHNEYQTFGDGCQIPSGPENMTFSISGIFPNNNPAGAPVQIVGTGFDGSERVFFGGSANDPNAVEAVIDPNRSATFLNIHVPETGSSGQVFIYVEKPNEISQSILFNIIESLDGLPASPPDIILPTGVPGGILPTSNDPVDRIVHLNVYDIQHSINLYLSDDGRPGEFGSIEDVIIDGIRYRSEVVVGSSIVNIDINNPTVLPDLMVIDRQNSEPPNHPFTEFSPAVDEFEGIYYRDNSFQFSQEFLDYIGERNQELAEDFGDEGLEYFPNTFLLLTSRITGRQYLFVVVCDINCFPPE